MLPTVDKVVKQLQQWFALVSSEYKIDQTLVAFSGGLDSTVLLHALARHMPLLSIKAVHINHGLQPESASWQQHCQQLATRWGLSYQSININVALKSRESVESVARKERYRAFVTLLQPQSLLLTAHHQDDQAETLLLQLLRGAGVSGLAAMPELKPLSQGLHGRPFLRLSRADLLSYARHYELSWIDDSSNADCRYDRNYIRHQVMPVLQARWPSAAKTLARSTALIGQAETIVQTWARQQLPQYLQQDNFLLNKAQALPEQQLSVLLRAWISHCGVPRPSRAVLHQLMRLTEVRQDAQPQVRWGTTPYYLCRAYRGCLYLHCEERAIDTRQQWHWVIDTPLRIAPFSLTLTKSLLMELGIRLPENTTRCGLAFVDSVTDKKIYPVSSPHAKTLKNYFQEQGVPPWQRRYCLLLYVDHRPVAVLNPWTISNVAKKAIS